LQRTQTDVDPPTLETLQRLRLMGMYDALQEQLQQPATGNLSFEERLGLLLDREVSVRATRAPAHPPEGGQTARQRGDRGPRLPRPAWPR